jgi:diketogulonate reductase-like aldo/keto reductase
VSGLSWSFNCLPLQHYFVLVGTYSIKGDKTNGVVDEALAAGYRLFDSAHLYNNEEDFGKAFAEVLPKYNLTRSDVFITTKFGEFTFHSEGQTGMQIFLIPLCSPVNRIQD